MARIAAAPTPITQTAAISASNPIGPVSPIGSIAATGSAAGCAAAASVGGAAGDAGSACCVAGLRPRWGTAGTSAFRSPGGIPANAGTVLPAVPVGVLTLTRPELPPCGMACAAAAAA